MWEKNVKKSLVSNPSSKTEQTNMLVNVKAAKTVMNNSVTQKTIQYWNTKVKKLTFQGDFGKLLIEEKQNTIWQSVIHNVSKGVFHLL